MAVRTRVPDEMWLGYAGLSVDCRHITAVVQYQAAWDRRIVQAHGTLPDGVRCVVILEDGRALPARRALDDIRRQWNAWQAEHGD